MTKSVASETDVPAGLDVVPVEPGTIVGARDLQGTDGTTRTDRPGEILGTPVSKEGTTAGREHEIEKADFITAEVDRANREELPRLGGNVEDDWEPVAGTAAVKSTERSGRNRTTERAGGVTTTDVVRG